MKQLPKASLLFIVLFLTTPAFADGDMGAGGLSGVCTVKAAETTEVKCLDSANRQEDVPTDIFSWVYQQIVELIG